MSSIRLCLPSYIVTCLSWVDSQIHSFAIYASSLLQNYIKKASAGAAWQAALSSARNAWLYPEFGPSNSAELNQHLYPSL